MQSVSRRIGVVAVGAATVALLMGWRQDSPQPAAQPKPAPRHEAVQPPSVERAPTAAARAHVPQARDLPAALGAPAYAAPIALPPGRFSWRGMTSEEAAAAFRATVDPSPSHAAANPFGNN